MATRVYIFICLLSLPLLQPAAQTPAEKGLSIATEADRRNTGWQDYLAVYTMTLRDRSGQESTRELQIKGMEVAEDGDRTLTVFYAPADIKGTALLTYTHALTPDDQWLYLPALKRIKRIASANKSGSFMGSEFAYEDLASQEIEKYSYKWLRDEDLEGRAVYVVERYPAYEYSAYTRQVVWLDQEMYQPLKLEFYDRKGALLKTLLFSGYQQFENKYWRSQTMDMMNHQTGKTTVLRWSEYRFRNGFSERDFDQNALKRSR